MKIIQANFYVKNDKREDFLADIVPLIASTRLEEGCLLYDLYESVEKKNQFVMIEHWKNQESIDKHNQNPLLINLFGKISEYAEKKTELIITENEEQRCL